MSWIERSVLTDPGLQGAVPGGETPRAWTSAAQVAPGAVREDPLGVTRAVESQHLLDFVTGSWMPRWARGDRIDRLFGGVASWGLPGSHGSALHAALERADGLLVTDHHLVVLVAGAPAMVDDPARPGRQVSSRPYRAVWTCPRRHLVAARRRGRLCGRGRIELYFDDRSMCAVMTGMFSTSGARRVLAALALPAAPPG